MTIEEGRCDLDSSANLEVLTTDHTVGQTVESAPTLYDRRQLNKLAVALGVGGAAFLIFPTKWRTPRHLFEIPKAAASGHHGGTPNRDAGLDSGTVADSGADAATVRSCADTQLRDSGGWANEDPPTLFFEVFGPVGSATIVGDNLFLYSNTAGDNKSLELDPDAGDMQTIIIRLRLPDGGTSATGTLTLYDAGPTALCQRVIAYP